MSHNIYSLLVPLSGSPLPLGKASFGMALNLVLTQPFLLLTPPVAHIYPGEPATALWTLQLSPIAPRMLGLLSAEILVVSYLSHRAGMPTRPN